MLFVLNAIGGVVLAIAMIAAPRRFLPVASVLSLLFMAGTLLALVLALTVGSSGYTSSSAPSWSDDTHRRVDRHHRARSDDRPSVPDAAFWLSAGWLSAGRGAGVLGLRGARSITEVTASGPSTSVPGPVRKMLSVEAGAGESSSSGRRRNRRYVKAEEVHSMSVSERNHRIVVAGAGYAGLHVAMRLATKLHDNLGVELTLVDWHDFHQVMTELPRVAGGTRAADAVRIPLEDVVARGVRFMETQITGFDLAGQQLKTQAGPIGYTRLVLALGSRPNDFAIPGLAERAISLYSVADAERVWAAVNQAVARAATATDPDQQRRLATVVIGGGGATGVELAGELAEMLPELARRHHLAPDRPAVILVDAGHTILAGSSPAIDRATKVLADLGVRVRTNSMIAEATPEGFGSPVPSLRRAGCLCGPAG